MEKFQYRTFTVEQGEGRDIDLDVEAEFDNWQEDGWEYVSGPVTTYHGYLFLLRRKPKRKSAYEDQGLQVI